MRALRLVLLIGLVALAACGDARPTDTPIASPSGPTPRPTPIPTRPPTPSPVPTPRFTNPADPDLVALLPPAVAGLPLVVAPREDYGLTPGDVGLAYGEVGLRFRSLVIAYVEQPRLTLYAMGLDEPVTTEELEPHLATAGRYVGIAGLDPEPWERVDVAGRSVWIRPGDSATAAGTQIATWSSGDHVFLMIGVSDEVNRALVAALPGEPPPASPRPSG